MTNLNGKSILVNGFHMPTRDKVDVLEARGFEGARLRRRIVVEDGRLVHEPMHETDALPILQVDRGKEDHRFTFTDATSGNCR